jgi:hypothetical protein
MKLHSRVATEILLPTQVAIQKFMHLRLLFPSGEWSTMLQRVRRW